MLEEGELTCSMDRKISFRDVVLIFTHTVPSAAIQAATAPSPTPVTLQPAPTKATQAAANVTAAIGSDGGEGQQLQVQPHVQPPVSGSGVQQQRPPAGGGQPTASAASGQLAGGRGGGSGGGGWLPEDIIERVDEVLGLWFCSLHASDCCGFRVP